MSIIREHFLYLTTPGRYPGIDTLRGIAIIGVVLFHIGISDNFWPARLGWLAVDLFFVISGFLIGSMIIKEVKRGSFSFSRFYKHRSLRILPTYYFIIIMTGIIKVTQSNSK